MDATLVGILIAETSGHTEHLANSGELRPVAFVQEGTPDFQFEMRVIERSPFEVLVSSTLPAGLLSQWAMDDKAKTIDWKWLAIFEGVAAPFWFLIGWIVDRGQIAIYRWSLCLVIIRIVAISLSSSTYRNVGWRFQVVFWLAATVYSFIAGIFWLMRRIRLVQRSAS